MAAKTSKKETENPIKAFKINEKPVSKLADRQKEDIRQEFNCYS